MDRRIRVLCLPAAGLVAALNEAIARARGEFIARMDADDISRSDRLARQVALLKQQPDVGVVSCLVNFGGNRSASRGYAEQVACLVALERSAVSCGHRFPFRRLKFFDGARSSSSGESDWMPKGQS